MALNSTPAQVPCRPQAEFWFSDTTTAACCVAQKLGQGQIQHQPPPNHRAICHFLSFSDGEVFLKSPRDFYLKMEDLPSLLIPIPSHFLTKIKVKEQKLIHYSHKRMKDRTSTYVRF
jgi:hypothetical protein